MKYQYCIGIRFAPLPGQTERPIEKDPDPMELEVILADIRDVLGKAYGDDYIIVEEVK